MYYFTGTKVLKLLLSTYLQNQESRNDIIQINGHQQSRASRIYSRVSVKSAQIHQNRFNFESVAARNINHLRKCQHLTTRVSQETCPAAGSVAGVETRPGEKSAFPYSTRKDP